MNVSANQGVPLSGIPFLTFLEKISGSSKRVFEYVVGPEGIEPPTLGLEIRCSIRLSYGPLW